MSDTDLESYLEACAAHQHINCQCAPVRKQEFIYPPERCTEVGRSRETAIRVVANGSHLFTFDERDNVHKYSCEDDCLRKLCSNDWFARQHRTIRSIAVVDGPHLIRSF